MLSILAVAFFIVFLCHHLYWKRRNFPPGPLPLPFIGNLYSIIRKLPDPGYLVYESWTKKYGSIYTYWLGSTPIVMINDLPTMKQTFVLDGETYVGKHQFAALSKEYKGGDYGVIETEGEFWRDHRRFAIQQLRDFGLNKDGMEQRILLEADCARDAMMKLTGEKDADIRKVFNVAAGSIIQQLLFGYRFDEEHIHEFHHLKDLFDQMNNKTSNNLTALIVIFPWLKNMPYFSGLWKEILDFRDTYYGFFTKLIEEHKKDLDFDSEVSTDYVEAYLKEKKRREAEGDLESFSQPQLLNMCSDLWFAGLETTTQTLSWCAVYLLNHMDVQEKLHEELDRVIGSDRPVTMADKNDLPYTCAVINETQRLANILSLNLLHKTTREVKIREYTFPRDTVVVAQISTVMYDEKIFPEPRTFNPSRFIDEDGKLKKFEELVPFSIGKRQCLGEGLARMELFLIIANTFNRFKISPIDASKPPSMAKTSFATMGPADAKCIITPRYT